MDVGLTRDIHALANAGFGSRTTAEVHHLSSSYFKEKSFVKKGVCEMSDKSKIEWTNASWNPVRGCTKIGAGCKNCYACVFAERFRGVPGHPYEQGFDFRLVPGKLDRALQVDKGDACFCQLDERPVP
jgi:hypothetical protein